MLTVAVAGGSCLWFQAAAATSRRGRWCCRCVCWCRAAVLVGGLLLLRARSMVGDSVVACTGVQQATRHQVFEPSRCETDHTLSVPTTQGQQQVPPNPGPTTHAHQPHLLLFGTAAARQQQSTQKKSASRPQRGSRKLPSAQILPTSTPSHHKSSSHVLRRGAPQGRDQVCRHV